MNATGLSASPVQSVTKVNMGMIEYGRAPDLLQTVLGSCVGIAVWDSSTGYGGLAHVMLPESQGAKKTPGKFADTAVGEMKDRLIRLGANPRHLKAKIAGGARMFGPDTTSHIGQRNGNVAREELKKHGIQVAGKYLGGTTGCMVTFPLEDGSVTIFVRGEVETIL